VNLLGNGYSASPSNDPAFQCFLDIAIAELLADRAGP